MTARYLPALLLLAVSPLAHAGPFSDSLSTCLVKKTTAAEKTVLVRWIFAAVSHHPDVKDLVAVSKDEEEKLSREMGAIFTGLLTDRCATEANDAVRYEGSKAIEAGFSTLGEVAGAGLMSHPAVAEYAGKMAAHVDQEKIKNLGQAAPAAKP
jgi:hypothetical protein